MSAWPDDKDPSVTEEEAPVSEVRRTPPPQRATVALGGTGDTDVPPSERKAICSIRPRRVPNPAAPAAAQESEPLPTPAVDASGRYATSDPAPSFRAAEPPRRSMRQAFLRGNHHAALIEAEKVLAAEPDDEEAASIAIRCRETEEEVLLAILGGPRARFWIEARGDKLRALETDRRSAVLMVMIKGGFTLGDILESCGEGRLRALCLLESLTRRGSIRRQ